MLEVILHFKANKNSFSPFSVANTICDIQRALPMLQDFKTLLCFCVDTRSVLVPVIISTSLNSFLVVLTFFTQTSNAFYYVSAVSPVSYSALHVIKEGFWQSYHWPTAVITKGMHSCLWLTRLGNVITKICLIGGAQGAPCEPLVSSLRPFQQHWAHIQTGS